MPLIKCQLVITKLKVKIKKKHIRLHLLHSLLSSFIVHHQIAEMTLMQKTILELEKAFLRMKQEYIRLNLNFHVFSIIIFILLGMKMKSHA